MGRLVDLALAALEEDDGELERVLRTYGEMHGFTAPDYEEALQVAMTDRAAWLGYLKSETKH